MNEIRDIDNQFNPGNTPEQFNPDLFHEFFIKNKKKKIYKDHIGHHILYQKDCGILWVVLVKNLIQEMALIQIFV